MAELNLDLGGWDKLEGLVAKFDEVSNNAQTQFMSETGEMISALIVERTLAGIDKNGAEFLPYSERPTAFAEDDPYFERGIEAGGILSKDRDSVRFSGGYSQFKKGLGVSIPNLSVDGRLLGRDVNGGETYPRPFGVTGATPKSVTIEFTDSEQAAIMDKHINGEDVPVRDPWGALETQAEADEMSDEFVKKYDMFLEDMLIQAGLL